MTLPDLDSTPPDRRIETSRVVPHSPAQVFQAFRDPAVLALWWGPDGFTNTFHEFDFQDGGAWRFIMHSPDGQDFPNESHFLKIAEPSLIIFDHVGAPYFEAILKFEPTDRGCRIDWCMIFNDSKTRDNVAKFAGDGLKQNLNRLAAMLNEGTAAAT